MEFSDSRRITRSALAFFPPIAAFFLQWAFWPLFQPYVWFLFYPAIFFSSRIGSLVPGMMATLLSAILVWWQFIPPAHSLIKDNSRHLFSVAVFIGMGLLFSLFHDRLKRANQDAAKALATAQEANLKLSDANQELAGLYEKTRELDELKTHFFANVSHELRTPLALILGPLGKRLEAPGLSPEARSDLEMIERNARLLHHRVSDLLDVAKLEAGGMLLHYADLDLSRLVRMTASHFESLAERKSIRFSVDGPPVLKAQADAEKCQRILLNLLSNAFKFTPGGGAIAVALKEEEGRAVLQVQDSGPGVPEAARTFIFDRFRQVENGSAGYRGGTGLGLAIVKEFVQLQGGCVDLGEAPGGGALFAVSLPLLAPADAVVCEAPEETDTGFGKQMMEELAPRAVPAGTAGPGGGEPLVLVVDDNPDMVQFLTDALRPHYRILAAADGQDGLHRALAERPDLILSDIMMPRMSGDEMVRELRGHPELDDVPIIILTARTDDALRVDLVRTGVQGCLNKPFSVEELLARVELLLRDRKRIRENQAASEARVRLLGAALEAAADAICISDGDGVIEWANPAFSILTGYGLDESVGRTIGELQNSGQQEPEFFAHLRRTILGGKVWRGELVNRRKDGGPYHEYQTITPVFHEGGAIGHFVSVKLDITERKQAELALKGMNLDLEKRVSSRTADLEIANRELESFAYAVSHDLRAPLRAINGFGQALVDEVGTRLQGEPAFYLQQIILASERMGALIDGLLQLSRSTRGEVRRDEVDLSSLAEHVFTELERSEPERKVDRHIEPGMLARGDARMLESVMRNLIGNAWKYSSKNPSPSIRVHSVREGERLVYCVTDNGAGFDMAYAKKLFQPFQRLHRQDEFPGLGIGLATTQRVIRRHGGSIDAVSEVGRGATFRFTLVEGATQGSAS